MSFATKENLAVGVSFHAISDARFKTNKISVHIITPLSQETATIHALIPSLLRKGYQGMSDFTAFWQSLQELYGAEVHFGVEKSGDNQILSLSIMGIDDRYTLDATPITKQLSEMLFAMLLNPPFEDSLFAPKELDLEKNMLVDAIESQMNDKRGYALSNAMQLMCGDEPFGLSELGTVEAAKALTTKQVTEQYHKLLQSAQIEIMFVGSGDAEVCKKIAIAKFASLCRNHEMLTDTSTKVHNKLNKVMTHVDQMEISQAKMVLGFASEVSPTQDEIFALRLMTMVLGGMPTSKLFVNVREKLSLCYYCTSSLDKAKGILRIDCGVEQENITAAKKEILRQLAKIQQGCISNEEFDDALLTMTGALESVGDSLHAIEGYYLAQILNKTNETPQSEIKKFKRLSIEDLVEISKQLHLDIVYLLSGDFDTQLLWQEGETV